MRTSNGFLLIACLLFIFSACRKDKDITEISKTPPVPEVIIETVIQGVVTDRQGQALGNTLISFDQQQMETDANGYFLIKGKASSSRALIKVEKAGYFHSIHAVAPSKQDTVQTRIQLVERSNYLSISSNVGGLVTLDNSATVTFKANSFVDAQGNPYNGAVNIYSHFIDPTDPEIDQFMPGDLRALDIEGRPQLLASYGMVNVELEDENGNPLQINAAASLELAVPPSILNSAPNEIPFWYFDESDALWKQEGKAQLVNGKYIGEVNHFTFWNCDVPNDFVTINGTIFSGEFTPTVKVCITQPSTGSQRCTYTSNHGDYSGAVPNDEQLELEVFDPCGNLVYSDNIGPYSTDTQLDPINIPQSNLFTIVFGNVEDCNQNPVSNGYASVSLPGALRSSFFPTRSDGSFQGIVYHCNETQLEVSGTDLTNETYGNPGTVAIGSSDTDLGTLSACGNQFTENVIFEYNGTTYTFDNCLVELGNTQGIPFYTFKFTDDQGNGNSIDYRVTVINWTNDPQNPSWASTYEHTLFGTVDPYFGFGGGDVSIQQLGVNTGEFVMMQIENTEITVFPTMENYTGGKVILSGRIE